MAAPLIYINAFPGTGKLTIAKLLQLSIPNSVIIDNHQLIDPVEATCPRGTTNYSIARGEYRRKVLHPVRHDYSLKDTTFIFTDSQTERNECFGDYTDLAIFGPEPGAGRRFYSVVLECEERENAKRLQSGDRMGGKLRDAEKLLECRRTEPEGIWKFRNDDELVLDVTTLSAEEAATRTHEWFTRREKEGNVKGEMWCA